MIHSLSYKVRDNGMKPLLYYFLLFIVSCLIYVLLFAGLVYLTTESSPF
jgi:hypothetical protein